MVRRLIVIIDDNDDIDSGSNDIGKKVDSSISDNIRQQVGSRWLDDYNYDDQNDVSDDIDKKDNSYDMIEQSIDGMVVIMLHD